VPDGIEALGSTVCAGVDAAYRGCWILENIYRPALADIVGRLRAAGYRLAMLSGDQPRERAVLAPLFGPEADLRFTQSPADKLSAIRQRQEAGRRVMMIGDGLNDAGALKQSDVGVAVSENVAAFSPACDVILQADRFGDIPDLLRFARASIRVVWISISISFLYNFVGIGLAAAGLLSPVACAILMPTSSVSVVLFAVGGTTWAARRYGKWTASPKL